MTVNTLAHTTSYQRIIPLRFPKISLRVFWLLLALLLISFLIFYIFQVNSEASERYLIKGHEKRIAELQKANQILEINSAKAGSLDSITVLLEESNFEKVEKIHYIQVSEIQVVAK